MAEAIKTPRRKTLYNRQRERLQAPHGRWVRSINHLHAGGLIAGVRVQALTDCDLRSVAADIDCASLRQRMNYYGDTIAEHLQGQLARVLSGTDVLFALSDDNGYFGVCGVLAYLDGVEACVYLHERAQGKGMLGTAAAVVRCAAEALGHEQIWVSIAADNEQSRRAVERRLPPGSVLVPRVESDGERHGSGRDAYVALVPTSVGLTGGPALSDSELALVRTLTFRQVREERAHAARHRSRTAVRGGMARQRGAQPQPSFG